MIKVANREDVLERLSELKFMSTEEKREFLHSCNISKTIICDNLLTNPQFKSIPMKSLIINSIKEMDDEQFIDFIVKYIDKLPTSIVEKILLNK